jgi:hypothetical protein
LFSIQNSHIRNFTKIPQHFAKLTRNLESTLVGCSTVHYTFIKIMEFLGQVEGHRSQNEWLTVRLVIEIHGLVKYASKMKNVVAHESVAVNPEIKVAQKGMVFFPMQ